MWKVTSKMCSGIGSLFPMLLYVVVIGASGWKAEPWVTVTWRMGGYPTPICDLPSLATPMSCHVVAGGILSEGSGQPIALIKLFCMDCLYFQTSGKSWAQESLRLSL